MASTNGETDDGVGSSHFSPLPLPHNFATFSTGLFEMMLFERICRPGGRLFQNVGRLVLHRPEEWNFETTNQLISEYGDHIVGAVDEDGERLFWDALKRGEYDCANVILDYARDRRLPVAFGAGNFEENNLLSWAIDHKSRTLTKLILDQLAEKRAYMDETCYLLELNLYRLIRQFPEIMGDFLQKNMFTFEYAKFQVPQSLFDGDSPSPVAMTAQRPGDGWDTMTSETAKEFWTTNCEHGATIGDCSGKQVTAVAKCLCISQNARGPHPIVRWCSDVIFRSNKSPLHESDGSGLSVSLDNPKCPVEVFESETLKAYVDWWFGRYRSVYRRVICLDVVDTAVFTVFAVLCGFEQDHVTSTHITARLSIFVSFVLSPVEFYYNASSLRYYPFFIKMVIMVLFSFAKNHAWYFAILTSLQCIFQWLLLFRTFRSLAAMGPLVSMVSYALQDTLPFMLLGMLLIFGYSSAFVVLFNDTFIKDDGQNFNTLPRALETLFHTCLGNFDEEFLRSSSGILSVWRSIVFNSFVYIGAIVLMSLLVAILTDTYDRVRSKEMAELRRCRLQVVSCTQGSWSYIRRERKMSRERAGHVQSSSGGAPYDDPDDHPLQNTYFHFLVPEEKKEKFTSGEWQGKLVAVENTIKKEVSKSEQSLQGQLKHQFRESEEQQKALLEESDQRITDQIHEVESQMRSIKETVGGMEERMGRIEDTLDQLLDKVNQMGTSAR